MSPTEPLPDEEITNVGGRALVRVAGGVLSWAGVALIVVLGWALFVGAVRPEIVTRSWLLICALLLAAGVFCAVVGFRLFLNRPNRYGSILPPAGWIALGIFFALASGLIAVDLQRAGFETSTATALGGSIVFALMCLRMARRTRRRRAS